MTILRLLVIFLLFWLIYRIFRIKLDKREKIIKKSPKIDDMKQCHYCGLHIPLKESIRLENKYYCNTEHRNLDIKND